MRARAAAAVRVVALVALAGCPAKQSTSAPEITGSLVFDGRDLSATMACRPGAAVHIFVDIVTPDGALRFEDQKLAWRGEPVRCTRLDRSWGGGRRPNNDAYWRGTLAFDCATSAGKKLVGDLVLDCGHITPEERASLDANRQKLRDEQAKPAP